MDVKNTHSVTKTEISVFGRQALDAERRRSPSLADKVLSYASISNFAIYVFRAHIFARLLRARVDHSMTAMRAGKI